LCFLLRTFCKNIAGLRDPRPRLLSFHEESNQRRAKEEVSSLDSPPRGFSPRELRKRSSLPLSAPAAGECQVLHLPLRAASGYVVVVAFLRTWGFKGGQV